MEKKTFYVTTSIVYANSTPHIGFAMEILQADILARYHRVLGVETFYLTGTDEHGLKIAQMAEEKKITPQELVDQNAKEFERLNKELNISNNYFVRTTDQNHQEYAQIMWQKLVDAGDIYKSEYQGLYCVGCERYYLEKELLPGLICPYHKTEAVSIKEENYFFKLSKYAEIIKEKIKSDQVKIFPETRKNEILSFLEEELHDVSFSRPRESVKWGIEIPNDPSQLMYVWCDALTNYLSVVDREKFWPADVQIIGKDILRFHAVYWIGMLLSAGFELPKVIMVHGFITSEGEKMSKSLGNVKNPFDFIDRYGRDALRYYLLREIPTFGDGDFSQERFDILYNEELANTFGNLVSRVLAMNKKYFDQKIPRKGSDDGFKKIIEDKWKALKENLDNLNIKKAIEEILDLGYLANKYVDDQKPWVLAKENTEKLSEVIYNLLLIIKNIGDMLGVFLPDTAEKILKVFGVDFEIKDLSWKEVSNFLDLEEGELLGEAGILFPKIE